MLKPSLFLCTLSLAACAVAENLWPSQQQLELVESRRATFPGARFVRDVDWYEPLEIVKGSESVPLVVESQPNQATESAIALAEQQDSYALLYWKNGAIRLEKYWPGFDETSRYDTASMHKSVVAVLLGIAQSEGLVASVDDHLATYLPELAGTPRGDLPLRSLLEMASGITTPGLSNDPASPYWQTYLGDDLPAAIARWPQPNKPFTEFYYANANTQYLGWVIERVSGKRYADYLSQKLWQPMGATDAKVWLDHQGGMPRMSCCLQATARDWLRFGLLLLKNGKVGDHQVVPADWLKKMAAPSMMNPNYGWQIWRGSPHNPERIYGRGIPAIIPAKEPFAANDVIYLDGSGGQRVYVIPSKNTVIVRIGAPSATWDDSELPNLLLTDKE